MVQAHGSSDHPDVAASYNNIGMVYRQQGKYEEALVQHTKSLDIGIRVLGHEHPSVAGSYNNIGAVYHRQGKYEEALVQYQKALQAFLAVYGQEHLDVAA